MTEPWVRFEDEHLLAVDKPAGVNTHRADVHAQDGMHEWVQRQRPHASLSVLHRLDKGTSGLLVFGKSPAANRALTEQLTNRSVTKRYELLTERDDRRPASLRSDEPIEGDEASTDLTRDAAGAGIERWVARPHSGRTHQVRIHAASLGIPVLGDLEHGGHPAPRLFLHAAALEAKHPDGRDLALAADRPASFGQALDLHPRQMGSPALAAAVAHEARATLFDPADTDAYLWIDRHHDGLADTRVERLGEVALVLRYGEDDRPLPDEWLEALHDTLDLAAVFEQHRPKGGGGGPAQRRSGNTPERFTVTELGARYIVDLQASATSSGLFLDQRETRRQLRSMPLAGKTVLNTFAHTGSLSVAAALAGAQTLTLDLSKSYLEWAAENLRANDLDPGEHDFVYGDATDWLDRFGKRGRRFDVVLVDPPSSSTPRKKGHRRWVADRDLHELVARAARVVAPGGTLFVSTNLRRMPWPDFLDHLRQGLTAAHRHGSIDTRTVPLDHRTGPGDPPYLKAAWVTLAD